MTNEYVSKTVQPVTMKGNLKKVITRESQVFDFLRNAPVKGNFDFTSGMSSLGGSLGACLVKVHKYKRKKDFLL